MNRMIRGAAGLAGPLALVSGVLAATAPPAAASPPVNESYALNAVGHFSAQMVGEATYSGGSPVILPNADTAGILSTGIITDTAGGVSASSRIPALTVTLPAHGSLHAAAVSSSCSFNRKTGVVTGHGTVTGGRITRSGGPAITLPASPPANTRMVIRGLAVVILNRQYTGPAGTLTVEALRVRMLRGHHQKLVFATSVCVRADLAATPPVNGRTLRLTLGGAGLLLLGGIAYQLTRRRRRMAAA
jgi:hypothetical protein